MTQEYKEIIQLNRELGEALGHLQGILTNYSKVLFPHTKDWIESFINEVHNRKSFLEDES